MQPIEELLQRIRWDREFGKGSFAVGYLDRRAGGEQVVAFDAVRLDRDRPGTFSLVDEDGVERHIPLHRVRAVYKDGVIIWRRPNPAGP